MESTGTKLCKKCRTEIDKKAKVCPQCRSKQGMGFLAWVGIVFLALIVIGAAAGGNTQPPAESAQPMDQPAEAASAPPEATAAPEAPALPDLEMLSSDVKKDQFARYIVGQVKNNTDKTLSYAQIQFNLYDDSGAQVGSTMANINNLEGGAVWNYEAIILEDNATSFKFMDVSGF